MVVVGSLVLQIDVGLAGPLSKVECGDLISDDMVDALWTDSSTVIVSLNVVTKNLVKSWLDAGQHVANDRAQAGIKMLYDRMGLSLKDLARVLSRKTANPTDENFNMSKGSLEAIIARADLPLNRVLANLCAAAAAAIFGGDDPLNGYDVSRAEKSDFHARYRRMKRRRRISG